VQGALAERQPAIVLAGGAFVLIGRPQGNARLFAVDYWTTPVAQVYATGY
jgi:hypothetical protein